MPMLGDVFINTVYEETPGRSVKTTDHPIEGGENVTDHTERKPETMDISGIVVGPDAASKLQKLKEYMDESELLKYVYRNVKTDVIIKDFETTHDAEVSGGFKFEMTLKEMRVAQPSIIKLLDINTKSQVAEMANKGQQQATGGPTKMHVVKSGDTLSAIGQKYGINWKKIHDRNQGVIGSDPTNIYPGQKLLIPVSGTATTSNQATSITGDAEPNDARMVLK